MKQHIKKAAFVFAASLALIACEKDQEEPTNRMNGGDAVKSKENKTLNKSSEAMFDDIMTFINNVNESSLENPYEAEEALVYTEASLNYNLTNDNHLPSSSHIDTTEYYVEIGESGGDLIISAEDIQSMNDDLYDVIYAEAESFNFDDNMDGKYISFIDMDWSSLGIGSNKITVAFAINNFNSIIPSCDFLDDWKPMFDLGGCNGNPAISSDAAQELNKIVNYPACNTELTNYDDALFARITSTKEIIPFQNFGWSQTYSNTSIWDDTQYLNVCLLTNRLDELRDSCIWISTEEAPTDPLLILKNITVGTNVLLASTTVYMHTYKYTYGEYVGDVPNKPEPCFSCI